MDIKNPKANQNSAGYTIQEREAFQNLLDTGFVDTYRYMNPDKVEYSWWSYRFKARERNAGWRIDYFLLSEFAKDKIIDAKIGKFTKSTGGINMGDKGNHHENKIRITNFEPEGKLSLQWKAEKEENIINSRHKKINRRTKGRN